MAATPKAAVYFRLLGFVRPELRLVLVGVVASCVAAAATAGYAYLVGPLLKAVLLQGRVELFGVALEGETLQWQLPVALVLVAAVKALAQWMQGGAMTAAGQRATSRLRTAVYDRLLLQPPAFYEQRHSGELLSRLTSDVAQTEFALSQSLSSYVKDTLQLVALLVVCALLDGRLFLLCFVVLPAGAIPVSRFAKALKKVARRTQASQGRLTELASEQLHNLPVVQAYNALPRTLERFDREQDQYLSAMKRSLFIRGAFSPTVEVLGMIGVALAIGYGAKAVFAEPTLADKLLSFLAAALLMYQPMKALSGTLSMVMNGVGAAERLFELSDVEPPRDEGDAAGPLRAGVTLERLGVSYDGKRSALAEVSFTIPAGKKVALVGSSGAGKSTLFSVLLGFLRPSEGEVRWDGVSLSTLSTSSVRSQLAWVPQEPVLFSGTVRHNLLFGRPDATDAQLWEALRRAHLETVVRSMPGGLEAEVGERGLKLSGGQRQRVAIARAFLKAPSLLLLDEPTSALDAESEREVQAGLHELMAGRTTLVIAHRLATVRDADLIVVLESGRVVEQGTHEELVARGGRYASLLERTELAA